MKNLKMNFNWLLVAFLSLGLMACGGSSDSADTGTTTPTTAILSGTAAIGAPLVNKTVTVKNKSGTSVTTTTDSNGKFTITVDTAEKPYMLKVETGATSDPLFSFINGTGTVNITPLTNLTLLEANKNGTTYVALSSLFSAFDQHYTQITDTKLNDAKAVVNATVSSGITAQNLSNTVDFFGTAFDANGNGIDAVLDGVTISITGTLASGITIDFKDSNGAVTSSISFDPNISTTGFTFGSGGGTGGSTLTGTWSLAISGTITTSGVNTPLNITLGNFPASAVPTVGSFSGMQTAFEAAYGSVGTVSNASYTITSSSSTRVVSNITADITIPGQTINGFSLPATTTSYNLNYTYTKQ